MFSLFISFNTIDFLVIGRLFVLDVCVCVCLHTIPLFDRLHFIVSIELALIMFNGQIKICLRLFPST